MALAPQFQATLFGSRTARYARSLEGVPYDIADGIVSTTPNFSRHGPPFSTIIAHNSASATAGYRKARHTLELYIDFVCPFSGKQLLGVREHLVPRIQKDLKEDLALVIRCTPQPWHASSTFVHEAFLAVLKIEPSKAWDFAYALMEKQKEFYDEPVANESPIQTKKRLAKLAKESVGVDEKKFYDLVSTDKGNSGSGVTNDLKLQVKLGRQNGIHVTPTCVLDGLVEPSISSSFGADEWNKFIEEKIKQ